MRSSQYCIACPQEPTQETGPDEPILGVAAIRLVLPPASDSPPVGVAVGVASATPTAGLGEAQAWLGVGIAGRVGVDVGLSTSRTTVWLVGWALVESALIGWVLIGDGLVSDRLVSDRLIGWALIGDGLAWALLVKVTELPLLLELLPSPWLLLVSSSGPPAGGLGRGVEVGLSTSRTMVLLVGSAVVGFEVGFGELTAIGD